MKRNEKHNSGFPLHVLLGRNVTLTAALIDFHVKTSYSAVGGIAHYTIVKRNHEMTRTGRSLTRNNCAACWLVGCIPTHLLALIYL